MPQLDHTEPRPHDDAQALLPWYAIGRLEEPDRVRVEEHLSSCSGCREQLAFERRVVQELRAHAPEVDAGWARLRQRLESQRRGPRLWSSSAYRLHNLVKRPALATLAAAQLAFLVLAGAVLLSLSRPTYHTLGSTSVPRSGNVLVIFRSDATVDDIRQTLQSNRASIVGGPTSADAYLIQVPPKERDVAIARLRSDQQVQLAEPVDGSPQ